MWNTWKQMEIFFMAGLRSCWATVRNSKHTMISKHSTPSSWQISSQVWSRTLGSWNDMETQSHPWKVCSLIYSLAKQVLCTTCWHCTGLVTLDGRCVVSWTLHLVLQQTLKVWHWNLFQSKEFKVQFPVTRKGKGLFFRSFEDQSHNSVTGGTVSLSKSARDPYATVVSQNSESCYECQMGSKHINNQRSWRSLPPGC